LIAIIWEVRKSCESLEGKELALFVGTTGAGKTTTIK